MRAHKCSQTCKLVYTHSCIKTHAYTITYILIHALMETHSNLSMHSHKCTHTRHTRMNTQKCSLIAPVPSTTYTRSGARTAHTCIHTSRTLPLALSFKCWLSPSLSLPPLNILQPLHTPGPKATAHTTPDEWH
jgi:hypothetical protein